MRWSTTTTSTTQHTRNNVSSRDSLRQCVYARTYYGQASYIFIANKQNGKWENSQSQPQLNAIFIYFRWFRENRIPNTRFLHKNGDRPSSFCYSLSLSLVLSVFARTFDLLHFFRSIFAICLTCFCVSLLWSPFFLSFAETLSSYFKFLIYFRLNFLANSFHCLSNKFSIISSLFVLFQASITWMILSKLLWLYETFWQTFFF